MGYATIDDKKVGVFVRFRAPLQQQNSQIYIM
jgi:hypothetical protein